MPFDEDTEFPDYNDENPGDVTETDGAPTGYIPYTPREYWCVIPISPATYRSPYLLGGSTSIHAPSSSKGF